MITQEIINRFWKNVDKNGPIPEHVPYLGNCWEWKGRQAKKQYGNISINGKPIYSHRVSYMIHYPDEDIENLNICHHCDNRACIRPTHLFAGTQKDNMKDCSLKGRMNTPTGERNPWYGKSRSGEKGGMYGKHHTEETKMKIGAKHKGKKMSQEAIEKIKKSKIGKTLTIEHRAKIGRSGELSIHSKLSDNQRREIYYKYHFLNYTQVKLAKEYNIKQGTVSTIVRNSRWAMQ